LLLPPPPMPTLFPYTTLFRSRPAHAMTMACTAPSAVACLIPSWSPLRTCWLSALTGGLSTISTATRPRVEISTDCVIFAMGELLSRGAPRPAGPQPRDGLRRALPHLDLGLSSPAAGPGPGSPSRRRPTGAPG